MIRPQPNPHVLALLSSIGPLASTEASNSRAAMADARARCFLCGPKQIPEVCRATSELPADAGLIPTSEYPTTRELGGLLYPAPLRRFYPALDRSDFQSVYYWAD
jgi:hypothetical protein